MYKIKNFIFICFWIFENIIAILNFINFYCELIADVNDHIKLLNNVLYILNIC